MSEKYFTVSEEGTNKQFKLIMTYTSSNIDFEVQSKDNPREKYELRNLNLNYFRSIQPFQHYSTIKQIVDVLSSKLESRNFILNTGCMLNIKVDSINYFPFVIKSIGGSSSGYSSGSGDGQLRAEVERLRRENLDLRAQLEKSNNQSTFKKPATNSFAPTKTFTSNQSYNFSSAPKQTVPPPPKFPVAPKQSVPPPPKFPAAPKQSVPPPPKFQTAKTMPPPKPKSITNLPNTNVPDYSTPVAVQLVGSYVPPSMFTGTLWERIDKTIKVKNDMRRTLDDIYGRLCDARRRIDIFVDYAFANNPTPEDKRKALNMIKEVLFLRQGFKDIDNYPDIFKKEVKAKGIQFSPDEKERFEDSMLILGKSFPYSLTPYHQKVDHLFIQTIHGFFIEKNLRFYKKEELEEVNRMKDKLK